MGKGTIKTKAMTMAVAMSMVAGLCPSTVFAANSEDVAKVQDGTYTGIAECTPDEYEEFEKYDLSVEVTIENGVIKSIGNIKGNGEEDNNTYITNAANGTKKDPTGVVQQIIDANGTDGINAVSRATCSSKAIVEAVNNALEEATKKEENKEENTVKTEDLQAVITKAEDLSEADYTAESWKTMQDALTAAKDALEKKESQTAVDSAKDTLNAEIAALVKKTPDVQKEVYVLMNIPYADFYKAEGVTGADTVSSATKQKTRASLAAGSYHVNSDGSDITGVTFPIKISDASVLEKYMQITESLRCELPEGTDGTGYWKLTVYGLGYADYSYNFEVGTENIAKPKTASEEDKKALQAKIDEASALKESDYTKDSWDKMMSELEESKELLASDNPLQSAVKEQTIHMTEAMEALVKVEHSVDTTEIEKAVAEAEGLKESDYTAESWAAYQAALANARTALETKESQEAVDNATAALNAAKEKLVKADEQPVTVDTSSLEKAIADAKALKEADYTADSWKALQSALSDAQKALEAKESQEAVDNATNSLNKAIKALVKKGSSSVKKTDGTTNGSKTSGSDSVKTGDPASVFGWLGLAVSSLGAGIGGFAWKRRKRK